MNTIHSGRDQGSATVWVLAVGLVAVLIALAAAAAGTAIVARHQAQAAADLAALAGAAHVPEGEPAACATASVTARANGARLVSCAVDGWDLVVTVTLRPSGAAASAGLAHASARAGPAP